MEILAALGLGRSYGMESRVLARTLPGILDSGLWTALAERPPLPTRALVTDVGNDILYGASPDRILEWVAEALERLRRVTDDVVVTGLPLDSIRRLSPAKFLAFRTFLFHRCRLTFPQVVDAAEEIAEGLVRLAARPWGAFRRACARSGTGSIPCTSAPAGGGPPGGRSSARTRPPAKGRRSSKRCGCTRCRRSVNGSSAWRGCARSAGSGWPAGGQVWLY